MRAWSSGTTLIKYRITIEEEVKKMCLLIQTITDRHADRQTCRRTNKPKEFNCIIISDLNLDKLTTFLLECGDPRSDVVSTYTIHNRIKKIKLGKVFDYLRNLIL